MRVVAGLAAFVLLSGVPAGAQYSPQPATTVLDSFGVACTEKPQPGGKGSTVTECKTTVTQGCPVDIRVRQRMGGAAVAADANGARRKVLAQRLRLFLNSFRPDGRGRKAVSAVVTVHGTGGKARMQSAGAAMDSSADPNANTMARTLSVDLANWGEPGVSGDFLLPGFTSASQVDLISVTYDDGSTWRLGKNETCRVAVDPLMLINR